MTTLITTKTSPRENKWKQDSTERQTTLFPPLPRAPGVDYSESHQSKHYNSFGGQPLTKRRGRRSQMLKVLESKNRNRGTYGQQDSDEGKQPPPAQIPPPPRTVPTSCPLNKGEKRTGQGVQ